MSELDRLASALRHAEPSGVRLVQGVCAGAGTTANTFKIKIGGSGVVVDNVASLALVSAGNMIWVAKQGNDLLIIGRQINAT